MGREKTAMDLLYDKLSAEYDSFISDLGKLPPGKIIEKSYEKIFKEDILSVFESTDISEDVTNLECGIMLLEHTLELLSLDQPLDYLYQVWMDKEESYMDRLRDCIEGAVRDISINPSLDEKINHIVQNYKSVSKYKEQSVQCQQR